MAKLKMPKGSPSIDMTPMVDLAFLLVTFFMLAATFRTDEPVTVSIPSSIGEEEIPEKTMVLVTVDKGGRVFFACSNDSARFDLIKAMSAKYQVKFSTEQVEKFTRMAGGFGCSIQKLPAYLDMEPEERKGNSVEFTIPADSLNNQLKDWIKLSQSIMNTRGEQAFQADGLNRSKNAEPLKAKDYKPKFVLKVDGEAEYVRAKQVIETFRDLNINNLNFVTSQEAKPE